MFLKFLKNIFGKNECNLLANWRRVNMLFRITYFSGKKIEMLSRSILPVPVATLPLTKEEVHNTIVKKRCVLGAFLVVLPSSTFNIHTVVVILIG